MAPTGLTDVSTAELERKLAQSRTATRVVGTIFLVIVVAWILLGYWRSNVPVFISTIAMGLAGTAATVASRSGLQAELRRRQDVGSRARSNA